MDLMETGFENGRGIKLAQGHVHWRGGSVVVLVVVNLATAVLCNEFHSICYLLLKKEMPLFLHHWYTAQWISAGCFDEMISKSFSFCRLMWHWQNLRKIWN